MHYLDELLKRHKSLVAHLGKASELGLPDGEIAGEREEAVCGAASKEQTPAEQARQLVRQALEPAESDLLFRRQVGATRTALEAGRMAGALQETVFEEPARQAAAAAQPWQPQQLSRFFEKDARRYG